MSTPTVYVLCRELVEICFNAEVLGYNQIHFSSANFTSRSSSSVVQISVLKTKQKKQSCARIEDGPLK